jgi:hypothetical protein
MAAHASPRTTVRGLVYREDGAFIETPYKIETYIVDDERREGVQRDARQGWKGV